LIGINQNGYAPKKLKEVMDKEHLTWRTLADPGAISAKWNAGPATYYIIDAKGLIRSKPGPVAKDIDAALEKVLQEVGKKDLPKPAEQYQALLKEYQAASRDLFSRAKSDDERNKTLGSVDKFPLRFLELAEKYPKDPMALDALVQVVNLEISFENNTTYAGPGKEDSPQARALALLLRDHLGSDKLDYACWRTSYGFHKDCERFLRTVLEKSPHKAVQGTACFRLAEFLKARWHRLDLLKERPEMARRYESLFGKDYLVALQRQDPAKAGAEVEALFERVIEKYADVKLPYSGTVGEQAKTELYEIRHLSVGKPAPEIEGEDQDGKRFKLSDYRGKVVLLYFWSEY
jgi:hypothetical protein